MKKQYTKPAMLMESFAISEHFATGGGGCSNTLVALPACLEQFNFGTIGGVVQQLYLYEYGCNLIPEDGEYGVCYHVITGATSIFS